MAEDAVAAAESVDLAPVRLVDPDGSPTVEDRYNRDLPPETLSWLYELMVVTRDLDVELTNLQRQGELALFASCRGQEAAQIGAAACLRKTDWLFPQYREIGVFLLRGITPGRTPICIEAGWRVSPIPLLSGKTARSCCATILIRPPGRRDTRGEKGMRMQSFFPLCLRACFTGST